MFRPLLPGPLALAVLSLLLAGPARGQDRVAWTDRPVFPCRLLAPDAGGPAALSREAPVYLRRGGQPSAQFEVTYSGFPQAAEAAFQAAVDVWAEHVTSAAPIRISAQWTALGTNVLGSAGPFLIRDFRVPDGRPQPIPGTWYPFALADALAGQDLQPGRPDVQANFNSAFDRWHFGGGPAPTDRVDLFTVVLHELGHGLGFIGGAAVDDGVPVNGLDECRGVSGEACFGANTNTDLPFVFDRYTEDRLGRSLLDEAVYPDPSPVLADVLQDEVFLGGSTVRLTNGGPAPLWTPDPWNEGSSFSHFDESRYPPGTRGALMTPSIGSGEEVASPDSLLCAALQDLGWALGAPCADLVTGGPPLPGGYTLVPERGAGDTILFTSRAAFVLTVASPQRITAHLYDVRGRRVGTLFDGDVESGETTTLVVQADGLASGLYLVRVEGEAFSATRKVVRVRP